MQGKSFFHPWAFLATGFLCVAACATGTEQVETDSGTYDVSNPKQDSGTPPKDTGVPPKDSSNTQPDTSSTNCGGGCLGTASTCCSNVCVDITSDPNNCGGCGSPCGGESCCSGNCVNTMGTDTSNCGGCGVTCNGTCTGGTCTTNTSCTLDLASCSHSPCVTGSALSASCDSSDEGIVPIICIYDATCCTTTWDATCVGWAQLFELSSCSGC